MEAVRAYYDGHAFVPVKPVVFRKNQPAIVTMLNEADTDVLEREKNAWLIFLDAMRNCNEPLEGEPMRTSFNRELDL